MWQGTERGLLPIAHEELRPQSNNSRGTESCQQPHECELGTGSCPVCLGDDCHLWEGLKQRSLLNLVQIPELQKLWGHKCVLWAGKFGIICYIATVNWHIIYQPVRVHRWTVWFINIIKHNYWFVICISKLFLQIQNRVFYLSKWLISHFIKSTVHWFRLLKSTS